MTGSMRRSFNVVYCMEISHSQVGHSQFAIFTAYNTHVCPVDVLFVLFAFIVALTYYGKQRQLNNYNWNLLPDSLGDRVGKNLGFWKKF